MGYYDNVFENQPKDKTTYLHVPALVRLTYLHIPALVRLADAECLSLVWVPSNKSIEVRMLVFHSVVVSKVKHSRDRFQQFLFLFFNVSSNILTENLCEEFLVTLFRPSNFIRGFLTLNDEFHIRFSALSTLL